MNLYQFVAQKIFKVKKPTKAQVESAKIATFRAAYGLGKCGQIEMTRIVADYLSQRKPK